MGDLAPLLGSAGIFGILAGVILYLLNGNRLDRQQYEDAVDRAEARANAAEARRQVLDDQLTTARDERRKAEDRADAFAREVHGLRDKVEQLTREVAALRAQVGGGL